MPSPVIHQLVASTKASKIGKTTATSNCGIEFHRNSASPLPDDLSGWQSDVTCPACLGVPS